MAKYERLNADPSEIESVDDIVKRYSFEDSTQHAYGDDGFFKGKKDFLKAYFLNSRARQAYFEDEIVIRQKHSLNDAMDKGYDAIAKEIYEKNLKDIQKLSIFSTWRLPKSEKRIGAWKDISLDEKYQFFIKQSNDQDLGASNIAYINTVNPLILKINTSLKASASKLVKTIKNVIKDPKGTALNEDKSSPEPFSINAGVSGGLEFAGSIRGYGNVCLWTSLPEYGENFKPTGKIMPVYLAMSGICYYIDVKGDLTIGGGVSYEPVAKKQQAKDANGKPKYDEKGQKINEDGYRVAEIMASNWSAMATLNLINFKGKVRYYSTCYRLISITDKMVIPNVRSEGNTAIKNTALEDINRLFFTNDIYRGYSSQKSGYSTEKFQHAHTGNIIKGDKTQRHNIITGSLQREGLSDPVLNIRTTESGAYIKLGEANAKSGYSTSSLQIKDSEDLKKYREAIKKYDEDIQLDFTGREGTLSEQLNPVYDTIDTFKTEVEARFCIYDRKSYSKTRNISLAIPFDKRHLMPSSKLDGHQDLIKEYDKKTANTQLKDHYKIAGLNKSANLNSFSVDGIDIDDVAGRNLDRETFLKTLSGEAKNALSNSSVSAPSLAQSESNVADIFGFDDATDTRNTDTILLQNTVINYTQDFDAGITMSGDSQNSFFCSKKASILTGLVSSDKDGKSHTKTKTLDHANISNKASIREEIQAYFKENNIDVKKDFKNQDTVDAFFASEASLGIKSTNNIAYISLSRLLDKNQDEKYECSPNSAMFFGSSFDISVYKNFIAYIEHLRKYTYTDNNIAEILKIIKDNDLNSNLNIGIFYSLVKRCTKYINSGLDSKLRLRQKLDITLDKIVNDALKGVVNLRKIKWKSSGWRGKEEDFSYWIKNKLTELDYPLSQEFSAYIGIIADYHNSSNKNEFTRYKAALRFMRLKSTFLIRFLELKKLFIKEGTLNGVKVSDEHLKMINSIISFLCLFDYEKLTQPIKFEGQDENNAFKHFFEGCVNFNGFIESLQNMQTACANSGVPLVAWLEYLNNERDFELFNDLVGNVEKLGMTTSLVIESCWKADKDSIGDIIDVDNSNKDDAAIKKNVSRLYDHLQYNCKNTPGFTKEKFVGFRVLKQENSTNTNIAKFTIGLRADLSTGTASLKAGDSSLVSVNVLKIIEKATTSTPIVGIGVKLFRKVLDCFTEATLDFEVGMTNNEERSSQALVTIISHRDKLRDYYRPTVVL
jgi:hypothetical protein